MNPWVLVAQAVVGLVSFYLGQRWADHRRADPMTLHVYKRQVEAGIRLVNAASVTNTAVVKGMVGYERYKAHRALDRFSGLMRLNVAILPTPVWDVVLKFYEQHNEAFVHAPDNVDPENREVWNKIVAKQVELSDLCLEVVRAVRKALAIDEASESASNILRLRPPIDLEALDLGDEKKASVHAAKD